MSSSYEDVKSNITEMRTDRSEPSAVFFKTTAEMTGESVPHVSTLFFSQISSLRGSCAAAQGILKKNGVSICWPAPALSLWAVMSQDGGFTRRPGDVDRWPELITLFVLQMGSIILMCPARNIECFESSVQQHLELIKSHPSGCCLY